MKAVTSIVLLSGLLAFGATSASAAPKVLRSGRAFHIAVCETAGVGESRCHVHLITNSTGAPLHAQPAGHGRFVVPADETLNPVQPVDLRAAYGITGFGSPTTTIAIVDAYAYPNAAADLAVFRNAVGLPPCTQQNGCLTIVDQRGNRAPPHNSNANWDVEQATDLDTVSTMCPFCKILLVQSETDLDPDLATAERTAATFRPHVIANSYGGSEIGTQRFESAYDHPGIAVTASTGDLGYGVSFPSTSPHVTAVGGTTLNIVNDARASETAWAGAGSGCSTVYNEPTWQTPSHPNMANNGTCTMRMVADVSADADPYTGVFVYLNVAGLQPGYYIVGGTSVSNQIIAGIYGERADTVNFGSNPYNAPSTALMDITSGSNGSCAITYYCNAVVGYDGPTGLGVPNGDTAF